jgi:hypothetical protein
MQVAFSLFGRPQTTITGAFNPQPRETTQTKETGHSDGDSFVRFGGCCG